MMWIVGTLIMFAVGVAAIVAIGRTPRAMPGPPPWDISSLGGTYTGIVGTIAGFSVASAIFIAGLDVARTSPLFATVMGMLLAAFLILVFSALIYASTPNALNIADHAVAQALSHVLANMCGCLGLALSWLALVPLLQMLELPSLAVVFTWQLLFVTLAAAGWVAVFAYDLTTASARACLALPVLGFGLVGFYRLIAARLWPALWPATDAALQFAFIAMGVAGMIMAFHLGLLAAHGSEAGRRRLQRSAHRVALAYSEVQIMTAGLIWLAVATP
ncbi:MAG: hypothetical protein K0Q89_1168 [Thermomicrobiales bacterium]|nr:hypothetical protein [Thermomicrobiales bacterium]